MQLCKSCAKTSKYCSMKHATKASGRLASGLNPIHGQLMLSSVLVPDESTFSQNWKHQPKDLCSNACTLTQKTVPELLSHVFLS
eukprot:6243590-Amphidinium_carterae.1